MKRKYEVILVYTVDLYFEIEADSKEEAIRLAEDQADPGLCHECNAKFGDSPNPLRTIVDDEEV